MLLELGQVRPGIGAVVWQEDLPLLGQSASGVGDGSSVGDAESELIAGKMCPHVGQ